MPTPTTPTTPASSAPALQPTRRNFIAGAGGVLAAAACPAALARAAGMTKEPGPDALILITLRGGADALSLCIPHADPAYYSSRPTISIPPPGSPNGALDLDGRFGFHPAMAPLFGLFERGRLAVIHAAGTPERRNAHFQAQHALESGAPHDANMPTGWLARCIEAAGPTQKAAAIGAALPLSLTGSMRSATLPTDSASGSGGSPLSRALTQAAAALAADHTLRAVTIDSTGWDTHAHQNPRTGAMTATIADLAASLRAFHDSAIAAGNRSITVIVTTEFGRTTAENATGGTDHGHGSLMLVLGKHIDGGRVITRWPGLSGPDLAATIDTRDILAEIVAKRMRINNLAAIFPGHTPTFHGVVRA